MLTTWCDTVYLSNLKFQIGYVEGKERFAQMSIL
jgi:hypothetical protein